MPRLHLKRTPAEEERRARKKAKKSSKKHRNETDHSFVDDTNGDHLNSRQEYYPRPHSTSSRRHSGHHSARYYDEPPSYTGDPGPSSRSHREDYEDSEEDTAARARMEEERFEEKLRDALEDDGLYDSTQRLDNVEARLNSYAHIPRRWRGTDEGFSAGLWMEDAREDIGLEPWQMNDDEYAEYIRAGMWRKKNQAEYEERLRRKEERRLRKEREERLREETRRLEREARVERDKRSAEKAKRRLKDARRLYEERWTALLLRPTSDSEKSNELPPLTFDDIPWPIAPPKKESTTPTLQTDELTKETISSFLLPLKDPKESKDLNTETKARQDAEDAITPSAKDILRTTMLRFHPDKFEARVLSRVVSKDKEIVKDTANLVVRILNKLIKENRE